MSCPELNNFETNNPHATVTDFAGQFIINTPWGSDDCFLAFNRTDSVSTKTLNSVKFDTRLDAIIHINQNIIEFAFGFLEKNTEYYKNYANRKFTLLYNNNEYKCRYSTPTDDFFVIAKAFHEFPSETGIQRMAQLPAFNAFCNLDKLNDRAKNYFTNKEPYNFFIELPSNYSDSDIIKLCRQINFIMQTYDRRTPQIIIRETESNADSRVPPIRYIKDCFPSTFILRNYDDTLLRLVEVAGQSTPRQAILYYYQVFEYVAYYYTDFKTRNSLIKLLKDPCIISYCEEKIDVFIDLLTDINNTNNNDETKIRKVIEDKCDSQEIWKEIENDKDFFTRDHTFEGGFKSSALIATGCDYENWKAMWHPKLIDCLMKIRNCIVHAREKRENKVISPTNKNNVILSHYVPIMERMARQLITNISQ